MVTLFIIGFITFFFAPSGEVLIQELSHTADPDVVKHPSCPLCGMDRQRFAHSRVYIEYEDGTSDGLCSVRCAALQQAVELRKTPRRIQVGDQSTRKLVDAEAAHWVLDKGRPGVMTRRAKWAFAEKAAAEAYIQQNSGEIVSFDDIMRASFADMYDDLKMIRERRRSQRARE